MTWSVPAFFTAGPAASAADALADLCDNIESALGEDRAAGANPQVLTLSHTLTRLDGQFIATALAMIADESSTFRSD